MARFVAIAAALIFARAAYGASRVYEYSPDAPRSERFSLSVDGKDCLVYPAGGAIVYGTFAAGDPETADPTRNISLSGNGIISGETIPRPQERREITFLKTKSLEVSGITVVHPTNWAIALFACEGVKIDNVKVVSDSPRDDGIDLVSCKNAAVENCFLRTRDDCIAVKAGVSYGGIKFFETGVDASSENILVKNCSIWNGIWGNALEIGFETRGDEIKNVSFENIDIPPSEFAKNISAPAGRP